MLPTWILAALLCLPAGMAAQSAVPAGTLIPVSLDHGLNAEKLHAGQAINATVMQDIPGTTIRRHAEVLGDVVVVVRSSKGISIQLRFDAVKSHGQTFPLKTSLRAVASFLEVEEAQIPKEMGDRSMTPETWDTEQIGGDQVYRGGGPVTERGEVVGHPTAWGVLAQPQAEPGTACRGTMGNNTRPQAFWLFSSNACGVYGFGDVRIEHAGRTEPVGTIILSSNAKLKLPSGSAMLLRVN